MRFQLSRNFLSNAPFIHCLYFIYARKNYATVELGLPVYLLIPQSTVAPLPQNNALVSASGAFYADRSMTREFKILGRSKKEQQDICFF